MTARWQVCSSNVSLHRNLGKKQPETQNQLCQNSRKQVYSNQTQNQEKRQLNGRRILCCFLLAFASTALGICGSPCATVEESIVLDPGRNKGDAICKLLCLCILTSLGATWKTNARFSSFFPNWTSTQARKIVGISWKHFKVIRKTLAI